MITNEKQIIQRVVEQFARSGIAADEQVQVVCLPENKTVTVERFEQESRSIMLDEYRVDGQVVWAGFSGRSQTVYVSLVRGR